MFARRSSVFKRLPSPFLVLPWGNPSATDYGLITIQSAVSSKHNRQWLVGTAKFHAIHRRVARESALRANRYRLARTCAVQQ